MNKLTKSTKFGLLAALILLCSTILYTTFFRSSTNTLPTPNQNKEFSVETASTLNNSNKVNQGLGSEEVAPVYSDIDDANATIQISEETRQNSTPNTLPQGFGLGTTDNNPSQNIPQVDPAGSLEQLPIDLETPLESAQPNSPSVKSQPQTLNETGIETMDPRDVGVTANDGPDKDYEETVLTVQRTLTAVSPDGEKQLIRLKIPVMYKSRTLRLEGVTRVKAQEILNNLKTKGMELAKIKSELESTLLEWNHLVTTTTPYEVLLPESPTLPQNQSAGRINREDNPSMSAGKAISYEIINK